MCDERQQYIILNVWNKKPFKEQPSNNKNNAKRKKYYRIE